MSDPNNPNTPGEYPPPQPPQGYPSEPTGTPQQPTYPPQPGYQPPASYPPQQGYPQQAEYPPQPNYPPQPYTPPPVTPPPYQPSPVQQPGYPQQPQGGYPAQPYAPPMQPQKSSNRGLLIGCGIALVVVLLICGGIGIAGYIGAQRAGDAVKNIGTAATAALVVTEFCGEMQTQEYGQAYQDLSSNVQSKQTQDQFVKAMQDKDTKDGAVQLCSPVSSDALPNISGSTATIQIQVARGDANNVKTGTLTLVQQGNDWKVDSADSSLDLF